MKIYVYFALLLIFDFYLKINIYGLDAGSFAIPLLLTYLLIGFIIISSEILKRSLKLTATSYLLASFLIYFLFRLMNDSGVDFTSYTIGTSGGVILFLILGIITHNVLFTCSTSAQQSKVKANKYIVLSMIFLTVSLLSLFYLCLELLMHLRHDIFLIEGNIAYQRPGSLLIISHLIFSTLSVQIVLFSNKGSYKKHIALPILTYLTIFSLLAIILSQMIGSNNATIIIAGMSVIAVSMVVFEVFINAKESSYSSLDNKIAVNKQHAASKILKSIMLTIGLITGLVILLMIITGKDISSTRIGGFGGSVFLSSVKSRLELLENFSIHFKYAPLFGNMNVHRLTTGEGRYVHSFILSILTHTGILGMTLFAFFIISGFKGVINNLKHDPAFKMYILFSIIFFFLIASLANFFVNAQTWFAIGMFFYFLGMRSDRMIETNKTNKDKLI